MPNRFTEGCSRCDELEDQVENLEYELSELDYKNDRLRDENEGLYDKLNTLNDACCSLEAERNLHVAFGKDLADIILGNLRNIMTHLDTHHPEIVFELLAMPELCPDITLQNFVGPTPFVWESSQDVYMKLLEELKGAY